MKEAKVTMGAVVESANARIAGLGRTSLDSIVVGRPGWALFCLFFVLYAVTASGDLIGDTETRWAVASQLVTTGWVELPPGVTLLFAVGRDGKPYSFYGPGQSICFVPFVLAGQAAAAIADSPRVGADQVGQFLASLIFFPACGALAVFLVYVIAREESGNLRAALATAIVFGLGTMHWHNSVNTYEESQVAICLLTSLWSIRRAWVTNAFRFRVLAVAAMGVALSFRVSSVVLNLPLGLVALAYDLQSASDMAERLRRVRSWLYAVFIGLAPFAIGVGAYNAVRFGSASEAGYHLAYQNQLGGIDMFGTPFFEGLTGMLFSPGKSVFLFNPVLLAAILGLVLLWRNHQRFAAAIIAPCVASLLFHATFTFWAGDLAWGPRYLASTMGLCSLGLIPLWRTGGWPRPVWGLVLVSVLVQVASIVYNFSLEFFQDRRHSTIPDGYVWRPGESQLVCRFRNLAFHFLGRPVYESIPPPRENLVICQRITSPEDVWRMHRINVFPFKAYAVTKNRTLYLGLLSVWIVGMALSVWLAVRMRVHWVKGGRPLTDNVTV